MRHECVEGRLYENKSEGLSFCKMKHGETYHSGDQIFHGRLDEAGCVELGNSGEILESVGLLVEGEVRVRRGSLRRRSHGEFF